MEEVDVVLIHAHFQYANWIGARLARRLRKPYVVFPHSTLLRDAIRHRKGLLKRLYIELLERRNLRDAAFIAFNADEERENSMFAREGIVIRNGIDLCDSEYRAPRPTLSELVPASEGRLRFAFLGRLDVQQKALDILIEAFALHLPAHQSSMLILAGPDENGGRRWLERCATELGVADSVVFTGLLSGAARLSVLAGADAVVMPSRFEGGSIALLETLSVGTPVLVSDRVGYHRDIAERGAGVVVPCNVAAVAKGLGALADARVRSAMRGAGRALIEEKFSWNVIASELIAALRELSEVEVPHVRHE